MTQLEIARKGNISPQMEAVAKVEGLDPRFILDHCYRIYRANFCTGPTADTFCQLGFTDKVNSHQLVSRYFTAPDDPNVPAVVTAAVAGMFNLPLGIVHHVNESLFFTGGKNMMCLVFGYFAGQVLVDHKFSHFIVLYANFETVRAIGAA